ncbi:hypothetical protein [Streptomyces boninensis]|uniref:poly(ethylene terephthalate) hydrolase family protein n=1 Tax=Streptomyces boninensis TaxID=2039455 RepID=UPI003B20CB96
MAPTKSNATIAKYTTAWLQRFLNGDTGATATLCPGPSPSTTVQEYRSTCPY